jgi:hypothetical protein
MIATDVTYIGMLASLTVVIGILVFAVSKKVKIDDGDHKGLYIGVIGSLGLLLASGGVHIWLIS